MFWVIMLLCIPAAKAEAAATGTKYFYVLMGKSFKWYSICVCVAAVIVWLLNVIGE